MARQMQKNIKSKEENIKEVVVEKENKELESEDEIKEEAKKRRTYSDGDYILCRSIIAGGLNINCRSGNYYRFNNYGDYCEIEYRDLVELIRKHSDHIFLPRILIEEDDFLEDFPQVKRLYKEMYSVSDLKEILSLSGSQLENAINSLPNELKDALKSLASTMIESGEIDSISKVRTLTTLLNADFNLLSELFIVR